MADENNTTESNERTITVKGTFNNVVRISDSFANGQNCTCDSGGDTSYSHAEGYNSSAIGKYSHADGYCAQTNSDYSYVWSGCTRKDVEKKDNSQGTFSIYGISTDVNMLSAYESVTGDDDDRFDNDKNLLSYMRQACASNVYVNGIRLSDTLNTIKRWAVETIRSESNTFSGSSFIFGKNKDDDKNYNGTFIINQSVSTEFNGNTTIGGNLTTSGNIIITKPNTNNICAQVSIPATFNDSVVFNNSPTISSSINSGTNDNTVATCKFVHAVVQEYLKAALGDNIIKN